MYVCVRSCTGGSAEGNVATGSQRWPMSGRQKREGCHQEGGGGGQNRGREEMGSVCECIDRISSSTIIRCRVNHPLRNGNRSFKASAIPAFKLETGSACGVQIAGMEFAIAANLIKE